MEDTTPVVFACTIGAGFLYLGFVFLDYGAACFLYFIVGFTGTGTQWTTDG